MALRWVFLVLLLRPMVMRQIQYSSTYCHMCMTSCGYVPSWQAPTAASSRGPGVVNAYPFMGSPHACFTGDPGLCPGSMREAGWAVRCHGLLLGLV
jgi:hypothetical protein